MGHCCGFRGLSTSIPLQHSKNNLQNACHWTANRKKKCERFTIALGLPLVVLLKVPRARKYTVPLSGYGAQLRSTVHLSS
jgi:hypothetical protein